MNGHHPCQLLPRSPFHLSQISKLMQTEPSDKKLVIHCPRCRKDNVFDQPYMYHAGFSDQGFMYNDNGHCTLVWSSYDPVIRQFFPPGRYMSEDSALREHFEQALRPSPDGGRWRFANPPRCLYCSGPIAWTILQQIYYLVYPESIITDQNNRLDLALQLITPTKPTA